MGLLFISKEVIVSMDRKYISVVTIVDCITMISGCCTIMQVKTAAIGISSSPSGAIVTDNNVERGNTPLVVDLKRKDHHFIKIEMPGYLPYETTITRSTSGWVWGNIVFGGIIGLAIDAMTGGLYKLTPTQIESVLQKEESDFYRKDTLYVSVVMKPDPNWLKIGQLEKIKK